MSSPGAVPRRAPGPWAAALAGELAGQGRVKVDRTRLLGCWARAVPSLTGRPEGLAELVAALDTLAAEQVIELPGKRSWDNSTRPALPRFVLLPAARRPARRPVHRERVWQRELGWAASLPAVGERQLADLIAIDDWLHSGPDRSLVVPARLRSAEIFGDEKELDWLEDTTLFGEGRVGLAMLAARRFPPPMPQKRVGPGRGVLMVENSDLYWACSEAAAGHPHIGTVVWGSGNSAPASVATLDELNPDRIFYWGDFDPEGLAIAAAVAREAAAAGLPKVEPAGPLWAAMAAKPVPAGTVDWSRASGSWLGADLWAEFGPVREIKARVAQERLTIADLARTLPLVGA